MKIVDRKTFIGMPSGTLFCKYKPCVFGDLMIKGDSIVFEGGDDFFCQQIVDAIACSGSDEWVDILFDSEANGTSFAMDFNYQGRDGLFEQDQLFAVWDDADVSALIERLSACRAVPVHGKPSSTAILPLYDKAALDAATLAEREACAKVCEDMVLYTGFDCAAAIRARKP